MPLGGEDGKLISAWAVLAGELAPDVVLRKGIALFSRVRCGVDVEEGDGADVSGWFRAYGVARQCSGWPSELQPRAERSSVSILSTALG